MTEGDIVSRSSAPVTVDDVAISIAALGIGPGDLLEVHCSLSSLGWVAGGAQAVVEALLSVIGDEGTLCMPSHTSDNGEPSRWENPPVPDSWWPIIRTSRPAFDSATSPSYRMGAVSEALRAWPGTLRSDHPRHSHLARGPLAERITASHPLDGAFGPDSPLGRLVELDAKVLLLGVGHDRNSILHVAEHLAHWPSKRTIPQGTAMIVGGRREWAEFDELDHDSSDFASIGAEIAARGLERTGRVGETTGRVVPAAAAVDVASEWMEANRT